MTDENIDQYIDHKLENLISINEIINYKKPKYFANWDDPYFFRHYYGKKGQFHWRPNKPKTKLSFNFKLNNKLNIKSNFKGIYLITSSITKYYYIGLTGLTKNNNFKQRLHSHIQKLTSSNIGLYDTPKNKWQKFVFYRYNFLGSESVDLKNDKINVFPLTELKKIFEDLDIEEYESLIYKKIKNKLSGYVILNSEKVLKKR